MIAGTAPAEAFLLGLDAMRNAIRSVRLSTFEAMEKDLQPLGLKMQIISTAKKCGLAKTHPQLHTLLCQFSADQYCEKVYEILAEEIPVLDDYYGVCEDGKVPFLQPIPLGLNGWLDDDVSSLMYSPEDCSRDESLENFLVFTLAADYAVEDSWSKAIVHFGWPFDRPVVVQNGNKKVVHKRDKSARKAWWYLKEHCAEDLYCALQIAYFPPDNYWFNIIADDDNSIEFTAENFKMLKAEWKKARPLFEDYQAACEKIAADPSLLTVLIGAMEYAGFLVPDEEVPDAPLCSMAAYGMRERIQVRTS